MELVSLKTGITFYLVTYLFLVKIIFKNIDFHMSYQITWHCLARGYNINAT